MGKTIIALVGLIAAGGIFFFYTKPTYDGAGTVRGQISQYDAALQKAAELQQIKQALLAKFNALPETDKSRLKKLLPDHVDNVRLILDLDHMASRNQMALQNVVVSAPQEAEAAQTAVGAVGASRQKYDSLTMKFTTQGTYPQFLQFVLDMEQSLRLVELVSLKISSGAVGGSGSEPLYVYDVTIRTYWLK